MSFCSMEESPSFESSKSGEALYKEFCADCHGKDMQAFVNHQWNYGNSVTEIKETILMGRAEGAMPSYDGALSSTEVDALVEYLVDGIANLDEYEPPELDMSKVYTSGAMKYQLETVHDDLDSPWGIAFVDENSYFFTEKNGSLFRVYKSGAIVEIAGVPEVNSNGQGGLMDVELHPDFKNNGWLYLSYSKSKSGVGRKQNTTAVARYQIRDNKLVDEELIFEGLPYSTTRHHYGSRMIFDRDGYLFITMGDRGARSVNPQDLSKHAGKVHRLYDDGRIPDDNPFVDRKDAIPSIWSYGHRNQQGMVMDPRTGQIWTHEHGPKGGDELNLIQKSENYGWPVVSYGINYNGTKFTDETDRPEFPSPVHYWVPSIAPCGMDFVQSDIYPEWNGHLLIGSLRFEQVNLVRLNNDQSLGDEVLMKGLGRVRDIKQSPDGYLYVSVENPGRIYRVVPVN